MLAGKPRYCILHELVHDTTRKSENHELIRVVSRFLRWYISFLLYQCARAGGANFRANAPTEEGASAQPHGDITGTNISPSPAPPPPAPPP